MLPVLAAAGYYAVAPSQRGYSPGARPMADSDYAIDHMVDDALAMATARGAGLFLLVGHDWGGAVAWIIAAQQPWRLKSLTVLSTPNLDAFEAAADNPLSLQTEMSAYAKVFATPGIAKVLMSGGPKFFALGLTAFGLPLARAEVYADALGDADALNAATAWYRANPVPPTQPIGPIAVPTLYLWGDLDFAFGEYAANHTGQYVQAPYQFGALLGVNHWIVDNDTEQASLFIAEQVQTHQ